MSERPRSQRRRLARKAASSAPPPGPSLFSRRDVILVALIAAGIAGAVAVIALLAGGGDGGSTAPTSTAAPTGVPVFVPSTPDELAIEALARRSIEVLPAGEWPSLYEDFTPEFQQRCPRQEFIDGGARSASELGANLPLLAYKRLEQVSVTGETATAVIVGEIRGQSEYSIQAAFQRVDGVWKLAPEASTEGCAAFAQISG